MGSCFDRVMSLFRRDERATPFAKEIRRDPKRAYLKLRGRALKAKSEGKAFLVPEFKPALEQLSDRIARRLQLTDLPAELRGEFDRLRDEAQAIEAAGVPYERFVRFSLKYIDAVDQLARLKEPGLATPFRRQAEGKVESWLAMYPDVILIPETMSLSRGYFADTRQTPLFVIGVIDEPYFVDGVLLSPAEFAYHDLDHAMYMIMENEARTGSASGIAALDEWDRTSRGIGQATRRLRSQDPLLAKAVRSLLFEVLHEKAYTHDLRVLRENLLTPRHVRKIEAKLKNGFFGKNVPISDAEAARLDEARLWLLAQVEKQLEKQALAELRQASGGLFGGKRPVRVALAIPSTEKRGKVRSLEFTVPGKIEVRMDTGAVAEPASLYDLALPASLPNLPDVSPEMVSRIEDMIWAKDSQASVSLQDGSGPFQVKSLRAGTKGDLQVELVSARDGSMTVVDPRSVKPVEQAPESRNRLDSNDVTKLRKALGMIRDGAEPVDFWSLPARQAYEGKIESRFTGKDGRTWVRLRLPDGATQEFPLVEATFTRSAPVK